jgi:20S proteasome subunit beta 2
MHCATLMRRCYYADSLSLHPQLEDAKELVKDAIFAGIFNDLGSGSSCDLCVITKDGKDFIRGHAKPNPRTFKREYNFANGATREFTTIVTD